MILIPLVCIFLKVYSVSTQNEASSDDQQQVITLNIKSKHHPSEEEIADVVKLVMQPLAEQFQQEQAQSVASTDDQDTSHDQLNSVTSDGQTNSTKPERFSFQINMPKQDEEELTGNSTDTEEILVEDNPSSEDVIYVREKRLETAQVLQTVPILKEVIIAIDRKTGRQLSEATLAAQIVRNPLEGDYSPFSQSLLSHLYAPSFTRPLGLNRESLLQYLAQPQTTQNDNLAPALEVESSSKASTIAQE